MRQVIRILDIEILAEELRRGVLAEPLEAHATVLFTHGGGSSRFSPRNRFAADIINQDGITTLLFDLLTPGEESKCANVFAIEVLARRKKVAAQWPRHQCERPEATIG